MPIEKKIREILTSNMSDYGTKKKIVVTVWDEATFTINSARSLPPEQQLQEIEARFVELREEVRAALATYYDRRLVQEIIDNLNTPINLITLNGRP